MKLVNLLLVAFVISVVSISQAKALEETVVRDQILRATKTVRLVVTVDISKKKKSDPVYDFEKLFETKLEKAGLTVVPQEATNYDATFTASCQQVEGTKFGLYLSDDASTLLGCYLRFEHQKLCLLWERRVYRSPIYANGYDAGVFIFENDVYIKYLSDLLQASLKRNDEVAVMIKALKDDYSYGISEAAERLGELKDSRAIEPLIALLKPDTNFDVVAAAAGALESFDDKRAIEPLKRLFIEHPSRLAKIPASFALEKLGNPQDVISFYQNFLKNEKYKEFHDLAEVGLKSMAAKSSPNKTSGEK